MNHRIEKTVSCVCGCHIIKFEKWTDDEGAWQGMSDANRDKD